MEKHKERKKEHWGDSSMIMYDMRTNKEINPVMDKPPYLPKNENSEGNR